LQVAANSVPQKLAEEHLSTLKKEADFLQHVLTYPPRYNIPRSKSRLSYQSAPWENPNLLLFMSLRGTNQLHYKIHLQNNPGIIFEMTPYSI